MIFTSTEVSPAGTTLMCRPKSITGLGRGNEGSMSRFLSYDNKSPGLHDNESPGAILVSARR